MGGEEACTWDFTEPGGLSQPLSLITWVSSSTQAALPPSSADAGPISVSCLALKKCLRGRFSRGDQPKGSRSSASRRADPARPDQLGEFLSSLGPEAHQVHFRAS